MTERRLKVIPKPEPGSRLVLVLSEGLQGEGPLDLICGVCAEVLAAGVPNERVEKLRSAVVAQYLAAGGARASGARGNLVLRCPTCGAYNEVMSDE